MKCLAAAITRATRATEREKGYHKSMKTFLWYDLETFGLNPKYDRIAQAACIRTDMDLNIIGEPLLLYCRLSPDYLPSPESAMITHITPQKVNEEGIIEAEFIKRLRTEFMVPNTITVGYNSIGFDDEVIRSTLYRNLYDPFEREYMNGCSRWDIINLVRATHDLRPDGIVFEKKNEETGAPSFKLTDLTEENNIEQVGAHDALVDVYATIAVAKLIKEKQPKLFKWALDHRGRRDISNEINVLQHQPFLNTQPMYVSEHGNTKPLLPLFYETEKSAALYCFDLTHEIPEDPHGLYQETGIVRLMINRSPFIAPLSVLDEESEKRLGFTRREIISKAGKAIAAPALQKKAILDAREEIKDENLDPDLSIYQSFPSEHDKGVMANIRALKPCDKLTRGEHLFENDKYHKILWRQVARNWPEVLSDEDKLRWKNFCALRLLNPPVEKALTYELYMRTIEEKLQSLDTDASDKMILLKLKEYGEELGRTILG